ncbi:YDG domain-containing protein, partial [Flavobacterium luteum]
AGLSATTAAGLAYVVTPSAPTGTGGFLAANYNITFNAFNGTVAKANLAITANNQSVSYGSTAISVTGAGSYTPTGFLNGDTAAVIGGSATYTTTYTATTAVGTSGVTITPVVTGLTATNYNFTPANGTITIIAGSFTKLQILLPGETAAPGTGSGKTGTPTAQNTATPFTVTVNAVDAFWNVVSSAPTNTIAITSTDGGAILPANAALSSGTQSFSITLRTPGSYTIIATNSSDGTKTANTSAPVTVTAGTKISIADGPWSTAGTWSPAGEPYLFDLVRINTNHDITVAANDTCAAINFIGTASTLSVNTGVTLTVTGAVTLDSYDLGTNTSATIGGLGTLNAGSLNEGLVTVLNNTANSTNTFNLNITSLNVTGDFTIYNNDEGGGKANEPTVNINSPCVLTASKLALIQTGTGNGGSRIITFNANSGATVNLSGGTNPISISSQTSLATGKVVFTLNSGSTFNYSGSVAQTVPTSISNSGSGGTTNAIALDYGNLRINNTSASGATAGGALNVNGNLTIGNTAKFVGGSFIHSVAGNWTNDGTYTAIGSTINFDGTGAQAIAGNTVTTFNDITIAKTAGTLSVNTDANVGDDLTFTASGGTLSVSSSKTLAVTDTVTLNGNNSANVDCSVTGLGSLSANNVIVGSTLTPVDTSAWNTKLTSTISSITITNNLAINSYYNNSLGVNYATFNLESGVTTVNGSIVLTNPIPLLFPSTFSMETGAQSGTLKLTGATPFNLTGYTIMNLNGASATVEYLGSVPQTALGEIYRTLKINNTNTGTGVTLGANATATTLHLTDGLLTTGANTMTIASGGSIINASANSYVDGKLARVITTTAATTFPLGKGGFYRPLVFTYATAPGTKTVTIEQFETGTPFTSAASLATFGSRYWNVTQSATGVAYRVGLNDGSNTAPSGSSVVILRRDNVTITANTTNYSSPNYTNATAFAAATVSNDVSLGVNNIPLSITGVSGINTKIYNGNTIATAIGTPTLSGSITPGDIVTLSGTAVYTFDTKNIGTGKSVTVSGLTLSGANASGYSLPSNQIPGLTGDITVRPITVTAVTNTKTYNGTTSSSGVPTYTLQSGDTTTTAPTQSFDTKDIGVTKTLTPIGLVINDGNGGNNYSISYTPMNLGTINAKSLTASIAATVISKSYDGNTSATLTSANYNLVGIVGSENVTISNTSGMYDTKNFGTGKTVTVTGLTLGGLAAGNYSISNPASINGNVGTITKVNLIPSLTGIVSKPYDGNTSATLTSGNYILGGLVPLENVIVTNTSGSYDNKNVDTGKTVTVTGLTIAGTDIANYTIPTSTNGTVGEITAIGLTITGATSFDKEYDTTTAATISNGSLVGILGSDEVLLIQEGTFSTDNAGGPYVVTAACRITGDDAGNYFLTQQPNVPNASITRKEVTIINLATEDKVYDKTNTAIVTNVIGVTELQGQYPVDAPNVSFIPSGYYASANVGNWTITSTTVLTGSEAGNYILTQPIFTENKNITPVALTVTGITADNKQYDGNTDAAINKGGAALSGVLSGETAGVLLSTAGATGTFDTKDVGTGKVVTINGLTISGANASNYSINPTATTANITPRTLTITAINQSKCAGGAFSGSGDLNVGFTKNYDIAGEILSVTSTVIGGDGSLSGSYPIRPSLATPGASNYAITYNDGTLTVNQSPTAIVSGTVASCVGDVALITFTGANGSGVVQYEFTYKIGASGTPTTVSSAPGSSTATVNALTNAIGAINYILISVKDLNSGCFQAQSGTATVTTGTCTQLRPSQCGEYLPTIDTVIQANPVPGATQYRFEITLKTFPNTRTEFTWSNYYFNPTTVVPGGGLAYGKEYDIRVKPFIGATEFPYGSTCNIKAPLAPPTPAATTTIRPIQCGKILPNLSTVVQASPVATATRYEFEVTDASGVRPIVSSTSIGFNILTGLVGGAVYDTDYSIRVRTFTGVGGVTPLTPWGASCIVRTPSLPFSKLVTNQCNTTVTNLTPTIFAATVFLAEGYRFRVTNGASVRVVEKTTGNMSALTAAELPGGYALNKVYSIDIAVKYNGLWQEAYGGDVCTITTPTARMNANSVESIFNVKAFPNPFATHFNLDIESSNDDVVEIKVFDMLGRQLEANQATVSELSTREIGRNYPSGVYNVIVSQGNKIKSIRMVKR